MMLIVLLLAYRILFVQDRSHGRLGVGGERTTWKWRFLVADVEGDGYLAWSILLHMFTLWNSCQRRYQW